MTFSLPAITDTAILRVCTALGLPETAFGGSDGMNPRFAVLKTLETRDVEACPGSGKTTLLIAKLAALADVWPSSRAGLCVLSHTNVARREIEHRLGGSREGRRLLSYPHFIGTIHGFVNEFLAIPWLRSNGYPIEMIDNDVTWQRRWQKLSAPTRQSLKRNHHDERILTIRDASFGVGEVRWGRGGALGQDTATYQALVDACRQSAGEGYFCYDEMFVWAHNLIDNVPEVTTFLRTRFPLLFIDEVQDNSEMQSRLLHRVFIEGDDAVRRQRYGDTNQAIYQSVAQTEGAETDRFPHPAIRSDIPNSFRFDQEIADFADPLALEPQGLRGNRQASDETESETTGCHAVFLFDDESIPFVLKNYASHLLEVFSTQELSEGLFTAVGAVHRPNGADKVPRHVGHYWPEYDYAISRSDPQPRTFVQYVSAGRRLSEGSGDTNPLVEKIAEAVIRLAQVASPNFTERTRRRKHRHILELLSESGSIKAMYLDIVQALAVERSALDEDEWRNRWRPALEDIVQAITGGASSDDIDSFLSWSGVEGYPVHEDVPSRKPSDNIFRYPPDHPAVKVRVGSIHAVKGETHTATLVLDTYYRAHNLKALKPWLVGAKQGGSEENATQQARLKLHYVAMTRPSRLLCLALREDAFSTEEISALERRGWRVAYVGEDGPRWRPVPEVSE